MTLKLKDRVKETSNSSGTGPILVYGTSLAFRTFGSELVNGETTYYGAVEVSGPDWEVGLGTYNSSPPSIIRTTILASSNNNNIVNFGANTKDVFITYPGERIMELAYGGTGATDSANARINLGVSIGSDVQGWDPDLDAIATLVGSSGLLKKNSANTWTLDTSVYLTSESDTFSSVTSRGSSTPDQIHITNTTNASSSNGAIIVDGGISVANNIYVGDNLSVENYIDLNTSSNPAHQEGRIFYNTTNKSLSVYNDEADISLEVGQENWVRVYNNTGNTIFSSSPVSFSGAILGTPLVVLSDSSDYTTIIKVAGLAAHDIETSSFGYVSTSGKVPNVNTVSYSVGTQLYVSGTEVGKLSSTAPAYPNFTVKVGIVLESNVAGSIFVNIQNNTLSDLNVISDARINGGLTVTGNLSITGTTTTIAATNLSIVDNMIYLNNAIQAPISNASGNGVIVSYTTDIPHNYSSGMSVSISGVDPSAYNANDKTILDVTSNTFSISSNVTSSYVSGGTARAQSSTNPDLGFAAGYNDGTYHHTGLFRDASDGIWKFFKNYTLEPDASQYIDTSHASFQLAPLSVSDVTAANTISAPSFIGDLSGTAASATNISDGGSNQIPFQTGISSTAFNSNLTFDQTNSTLSTQNIIISGNTSLGAVDNISITGGTDGYVLTTDGAGNLSWLQATQNTVIYIVQSLSLANGVYVSGSLSDIQTFADSNYYTLTDGTGTGPAWVFTTGFTDVVSFNRVVLNINYTAASGHTIYVQLYNNSTAVWDTIGTYTGLGSFYAFALQVVDGTPYISSGAVQLRLWHSNAGNALHTTNIDYVALEMSTQGPQGPKGTTGTTGATGATGAGVASGGTSGQILIKNSATNYDTSWVNNLAYDVANTANLNAANASYLSTGVVSNSLLSSIPNSSLANSTISGIQLGSNLNALSNGVGLLWSSGTNFNGSSAATLEIDSSVVTLTGSQTLTNKRLTLPVVDFTGIKIDGSTSGNTTIQATPIAGSSILTLSANTGTLISTGDTGTVTSAMILNGTIVDADINSAAAISTSKLAANTISGVYLGGNLFSLVTGNGLSGGSYNGSGSVTISANTGSTTVAGILQLNDTVISTSTSLAATANSVKTAYDQATNANTFNQAYTNSVVASNNSSITTAYKSYTDSVVSSNNITLKSYTDSVVASNNSSITTAYKSYTDSVVSSNNISLKAYTDSVVSSNNVSFKAYTDSVVSSNNISLKAYTDSVVSSNNVSLKAYTDSIVSSNNSSLTTAYKSYTDSVVSSNNTTLKAYTDSVVSSNNSSLRANDGITLASAKSYTDSANTFLQANDGITLASAKSYTDAKNTFSTAVTVSNDLTVSGNLTIQGTTTTLNSTTIRINDKNIELANVATPTNTTADGGGITVIGATNKTFNWVNSTGAWTSSENLDLATGKSFSINGVTVLTGSTLSSNVTTSSLTAVGTITSGVWSSSFGAVSGANLTNLTAGNLVGVINNIPIGSGTANTGAFTTISASGQFISTAANNIATGGGQIYLNGTTGNRIDFNNNGVGAPTFTTRSLGTKIVLNSNLGATTVDYALGIESNTLWSSVPTGTRSFKWYAGTTDIATLSGTGTFSTSTLTSTVATGTAPFTVTSTTNVANLNASSLSGATFASPGPIGSGTASTGAFTTLSASSTVSGAGFSAYLESPPAIGSTTANTGAFTNLSYTGTLTGSTGILNIGTNQIYKDASGNVGIGTSSPSGKLGIVTTASTAAWQIVANTTGVSNQTGIYADASNNMQFAARDGSGVLRVVIDSNSSTNSYINSGNVGIGTASPSYKLQVAGSFAATTKSFVIDHPTKEGMKLRYGSLEGPENGIYIRGRLNGNNIIELPKYWTKLIDEDSITVNLTPIGKHQKLYVADIVDNTVIIGNDNLLQKEINCFYTVFAERIDVEKLIVEIE